MERSHIALDPSHAATPEPQAHLFINNAQCQKTAVQLDILFVYTASTFLKLPPATLHLALLHAGTRSQLHALLAHWPIGRNRYSFYVKRKFTWSLCWTAVLCFVPFVVRRKFFLWKLFHSVLFPLKTSSSAYFPSDPIEFIENAACGLVKKRKRIVTKGPALFCVERRLENVKSLLCALNGKIAVKIFT